MAEVDKFFVEVRSLLETALDSFVPASGFEPARLYEAIRWSLFGGGKRFRPALVIAAGRVFGAADTRLLTTATAVELVHTYSLIHDDLPSMDNDDLRRGRATVHIQFDEATAILAGDALQAMAFQAIADDEELSEALRLKLIQELSVAASRMVAGQQLDLEAERRDVDLAEIENIHQGKTGALIRFSVRAGGMIADAEPEELAALTTFGEKLGLLFQITDDILDVTSTSEELGKTVGKDVASKKATYPEVLGLDGARALVEEVENDAIQTLRNIGRDTKLLAEICRFVSRRNS